MDEENIEPQTTGVKVPLKKSFLRWNMSALSATAIDFSTLSFLYYVLGVFYPIAIAVGAFFGSCIAFILGRNWTFMNKEGKVSHQGMRFIFTAGLSMFFNTSGVTFFVEVMGIDQVLIAKLITATLIGIFFNFPMQRYFVYK